MIESSHMAKMIESFHMAKWQSTMDMLAEAFNVPAALIMALQDEYIEVFISGNSDDNPYIKGDKELFDGSGLYCERVIKSNSELLVPNALKDGEWKNNPDIKLGMISYLGFPLIKPSGVIFGTICVLDNKENYYSSVYRKLLEKFKDHIELDLILINKEIEEREKNEELKKANRELMHITKQLQEEKLVAEKANQAKSDFLSSMSHELRTPMNAVLGFSQLIEMDTQEEKTRERVHAIRASGGHLLGLINEVLDLAKIETGKLDLSIQEVDLNKLVSECISLTRPLAKERSISVTENITSTSNYRILADQTRLRQIMFNLLSNAMKYNKEKGSVTLECAVLPSGQLRISVSDTGEGMTEEQQHHIFKPFERAGAEKTKTEGTGIGLAICKRLIEAMNGTIGFNSKLGSGSIFWVDLPMVGYEESTHSI